MFGKVKGVTMLVVEGIVCRRGTLWYVLLQSSLAVVVRNFYWAKSGRESIKRTERAHHYSSRCALMYRRNTKSVVIRTADCETHG